MSCVEDDQKPALSVKDCHAIVNRYLKSENYELGEYSFDDLGDTGGFLGRYYCLTINIKHGNKDKQLKFFTKVLPKSAKVFEEMAQLSFRKEQFMYERFFPQLENVQSMDFKPECYLCKADQMIVLENLTEKGYSTCEFRKFLDYDVVVQVVKQIARFHSYSIILEEKRSKELRRPYSLDEEYSEYFEDINLAETGPTAVLFKLGIETNGYMAEQFPDVPKDMTMDQFKHKIYQVAMDTYKYSRKSNKFRNVICEGDLWIPNIMVKKDSNGKVLSCRIVDYQLIRYCPLMFELAFFIHVCTRKHVRQEHFRHILDVYFEQLSDVLEQHDVDMKGICAYDTFLESYFTIRPAAICTALCYLQVGLLHPDKLNMLRSDPEEFDHFLRKDRVGFYQKHNIFDDYVFMETIGELFQDLYDCFVRS